ncbi:GNAT family N-acetyltransferase [Candidatus Poribacteria bacterium]|nr:GNAT family N-acetyltransferase [Candidatus Poribacteria bacterium]
MRNTITYRHWQPGDDDAVLKLLVPAEQCKEDYYRRKFNDPSLEPEGIRIALVGKRVVGHVYGSQTSLIVEGKVQDFGLVTLVFVAPDMRQQGIATRLMQDLNAYFEEKGYRGSILYVETAEAYQLYEKVGYQKVTRELRTELPARPNSSPLKWRAVKAEDFDILHQLKKRWGNQNFPIFWNHQVKEIHQFSMKQYRVLRRGTNIIGYAKWDEPSGYRPQGLIRDPIAPDEDPMDIITSVQAEITAMHAWQTTEGSRYEDPLCSLGCILKPTKMIDMLASFGQEIDLSEMHRTVW